MTPDILKLINAIQALFIQNQHKHLILPKVVDTLSEILLSPTITSTQPPALPGHENVLNQAIAGIPEPELSELSDALKNARDDIEWRFDEGDFYPRGADLGAAYINGNMNCELIGPNSCGLYAKDFILGFFMLAPRTLYRDHRHEAPELYFNLTEPTGWRIETGPWQDLGAGSVVWNPPQQVHAMRTYNQPFLSIYCWTQNVDQLCEVVPAPDWLELQQELHQITGRNQPKS